MKTIGPLKKESAVAVAKERPEQERSAAGKYNDGFDDDYGIPPARPYDLALQDVGASSSYSASRARLKRALRNPESDFLEALLVEAELACTEGGAFDITSFNLVLAIIEADKPKDHNEALISVLKGLMFRQTTRSMHLANSPLGQNLTERQPAKFAAAFMKLTLGLNQYRSSGSELQMRVNNLLINKGQAILGNVTHTSIPHRPVDVPPVDVAAVHPALTDAGVAAMPLIKDPDRVANDDVPVPARELAMSSDEEPHAALQSNDRKKAAGRPKRVRLEK